MVDGVDTGETWPRGRHLLPLLAVAALCLNVVFIVWYSVSGWELRLAKTDFTGVASDYGDVLQRGLDDYLSKLAAVHAFYDSSVEVERSEFKRFTGHILDGQESVMRITWSPYVTGAERDEFVRKVRRSGLADFGIEDLGRNGEPRPAAERSSYFPVLYATPDPTLRPVIGLDLASEPARRKALQRARDGARMATTPDIRLRGVSGDLRGFFVALPVYHPGMPHRTGEERRRNTVGILGGSFQTAAVVDEILREAKLAGGVDLYLFAADAKGESIPALTRALPAATAPLEPRAQAELASLPHWQG